jgi:glutathione S-transferase
MTKIEIVGYDYCPFLQPTIITLNEKEAKFTVTYIEPDNKPCWATEVSPQGATPFMLVNGKALFESVAMNEFVNDVTSGDLHPEDVFLKAQNRMWISRSYELLDHIYDLKTTNDQEVFKAEKGKLITKLRAIDEVICENPFFNGSEFCLVDGAFAPVLRTIAMLDDQFSTGLLEGLTNVERWSNNILNRPSVQASVVESFHDKSVEKIAVSDTTVARRRSDKAA